MTKHARFRQADLARALKACRDAGYSPRRVEVSPDTFTIFILTEGEPANGEAGPEGGSPLTEDGLEPWD